MAEVVGGGDSLRGRRELEIGSGAVVMVVEEVVVVVLHYTIYYGACVCENVEKKVLRSGGWMS